MATITNFNGALQSRELDYSDVKGATDACDQLRAHFYGDTPLGPMDVLNAVEAIRAAIPPNQWVA